jgi:eukaryotic-like serine/threonine-protein kinase
MPEIGAQLDRFVLLDVAGQGGQGTVWKVRDVTRPGSLFALKLVPLPAASTPWGAAEASAHIARLRREAQSLAQLDHPSIVRCHGLFEDYAHGVIGLVLDWVEGQPLHEAERDPRMTHEFRLVLLRHLAFALARLHGAGLVHRDIKPANVLISSAFFAAPGDPRNLKLVDLGVVVPVNNPQPLTQPGDVVGTEAYMAPELADAAHERGLAASPATDVFAFGVLGWALLTGAHPSGLGLGASFLEYFLFYRSVLAGESPWPAGGELGGAWGNMLKWCLSLRLEERPASGAEVAEAIEGATLRIPSPGTALRSASGLAIGMMLPTRGAPPSSSPSRAAPGAVEQAPLSRSPRSARTVIDDGYYPPPTSTPLPTFEPALQRPSFEPAAQRPSFEPALQRPLFEPALQRPLFEPAQPSSHAGRAERSPQAGAGKRAGAWVLPLAIVLAISLAAAATAAIALLR